MSELQSTVAIDVGNSAVKVAVLGEPNHDREPRYSHAVFSLTQTDWVDRALDWLVLQTQSTDHSSQTHCWVSTVNRSASDPIRNRMETHFPSFGWTQIRLADVPLLVDVDFPDRVGIDRLIGAYAATTRFQRPVVVVDIGSAVTVDLVKEGPGNVHQFCGGAILPGIRLQLAALFNGTEGIQQTGSDHALSPAEWQQSISASARKLPAKNTADAIVSGVMASIIGGVEFLTATYRSQLSTNRSKEHQFPVVLTGGDAAMVSPMLKIPHVVIDQLVCRGLFDLANLSVVSQRLN